MSDEYRIEFVLSADELVKFGNAIAAICFFPRFVQAEAGRLADCCSNMADAETDKEFAARLMALKAEATAAFNIGDWLAHKIGAAKPRRVGRGPLK
jgi:hypothetical protein